VGGSLSLSLSLSATRQCGHTTVKVIDLRGKEKMMGGSVLLIYFEKMMGGSLSVQTVQNSGK